MSRNHDIRLLGCGRCGVATLSPRIGVSFEPNEWRVGDTRCSHGSASKSTGRDMDIAQPGLEDCVSSIKRKPSPT